MFTLNTYFHACTNRFNCRNYHQPKIPVVWGGEGESRRQASRDIVFVIWFQEKPPSKRKINFKNKNCTLICNKALYRPPKLSHHIIWGFLRSYGYLKLNKYAWLHTQFTKHHKKRTYNISFLFVYLTINTIIIISSKDQAHITSEYLSSKASLISISKIH